MKVFFENIVEFIDRNNKIIIKISLTILGIILLAIFIMFTADNFSVGSETNKLIGYIEKRNYSESISYYKKLEGQFSQSKIDRLNKSLSKKVNKILITYGDKYIKGEIGKDYFITLINIINELENIRIDTDSIINQAKRVNDLYLDENITYSTAIGYIQAISTLKISKNEIYVYTKKIDVIEDSRKIYEEGLKNKEKQLYKEAIEDFDKVISEDRKYYELAQDKKEECIKEMHDYYIDLAKTEDKNGNYQKALGYIDYLKQYYLDDSELDELSSTFEKNLKMYNMTNDEIIQLISKKSGIDIADLKTNIFQQMLNGSKFYYVETFVGKEKNDEVLINPKNKKLYSYLDERKSYNNKYGDGYWRAISNGLVEFTISKGTAQSILEKKLNELNEKYKYVTIEEKEKALKYVKDQKIIDNFIGKKNDIYYYAVVNRGFFKSKQVYLVNPYSKEIYKANEGNIKKLNNF